MPQFVMQSKQCTHNVNGCKVTGSLRIVLERNSKIKTTRYLASISNLAVSRCLKVSMEKDPIIYPLTDPRVTLLSLLELCGISLCIASAIVSYATIEVIVNCSRSVHRNARRSG